MGCGKYHGKHNEREDGKILAYKRNRKPLLNFPTTKALQDFIGTIIRKSIEAEGPRYLKTQGYSRWAKLATQDSSSTAEYIARKLKDNSKLIRVEGDAMWADIRSITLHKKYVRPSKKKKEEKIPSGHQQIVTGVIKNIGDTPIRNILIKLELISKKTGRRSDIAVGMAKQRSDFQNFLRKRPKGKRVQKFLPKSEEVLPLMPNESVMFEARTHNYREFVWNDDKHIDMAIPMHEAVSYEKFVRGGVGDGRWIKVGEYRHKGRGYFHNLMAKKIKDYYKEKLDQLKESRANYRIIKPKVRHLLNKKFNVIELGFKNESKQIQTLKQKIKKTALKNVRDSVVKLKDDERIYIYYTRGTS